MISKFLSNLKSIRLWIKLNKKIFPLFLQKPGASQMERKELSLMERSILLKEKWQV